MSLWFRRIAGINSTAMRESAEKAGVSWSAKSIVYRGNGIGYANGEESDADAIQNAAESILGYRPVVIDEPS